MDIRHVFRQGDQNNSDRGAILVITALVMLVMLMIAAFATDLGAWYRQAQEQQRSADLGSLNGIQSYEEARRDAFAVVSASSWSDISDPVSRQAVEEALLIEAVDAIIGVFDSAGSNVIVVPGSNPDWNNAVISDPGGSPVGESSVQFETSDGMTVIVTRTIDLTISVSVSQPGTQYFSSVITGAPTIERLSTAQLSNCGAVCDVEIILDPPFVGFSSTGSGDGFAPVLDTNDNNVWAVNHHRRLGAQGGEIVCMDVDTGDFCGATYLGDHSNGGRNSLGSYGTHNRPAEEYLHQSSGKLYFVAYNWNTERSGVVCYNTNTFGYCGFADLWDQTAHNTWSAQVNATGPWVHGGRMYVMAQDGQLGCVNLDMSTCGMWNTSVVGHPDVPAVDSSVLRIINGEKVGDRIFFTHYVGGKTVFSCWDIGSANDCGWGGTVDINYLDGREDRRQTFLRSNTGGVATHICVADLESGRNGCVTLNGAGIWEIPGLSTHLAPLMNSWAGDAFDFRGQYTFFAGGNSNLTGCWSWITQSSCGLLDHGSFGFHQAGPTDPYAYAEVNATCIMGLGDKSVYFSFKPTDMSPCLDTTASVDLEPCTCADGSPTWGELVLPDSLLNDVTVLRGTVYRTSDPSTIYVDDVDLFAVGGRLDLSHVPTTVTDLTLDLDMVVKLDVGGKPVWTVAKPLDLQLVVQPTLAG